MSRADVSVMNEKAKDDSSFKTAHTVQAQQAVPIGDYSHSASLLLYPQQFFINSPSSEILAC